MKVWLKGLGLLVRLPTVAIALFFLWASSNTVPKQDYASVVEYGAPATQAKDSYTIVSYNLGYLSGLVNNTTQKPTRDFFDDNQRQAIAALESVQPDIVGFQEIDIDAKRSYGVNQVREMAKGLDMGMAAITINWDKNYLPFPYWPISAHFGKILSGQAIVSRYPVESNNRIVLERVKKSFVYNAFYLERLAQVSKVRLGEQSLVVINVHLEAFEEETRVRQTQFVRSLAEDYAQDFPVIIMGDFNSALNRSSFITATGENLGERQFSIKEMLASDQLAAAMPETEWGSDSATFPADAPEYKLDYLFYTSNTIEVLNTQVISAAAQASDHLPVMMQFRLK
ncbi:MAG: endonuclease/exonuclease/phosphatase family protein [Cyanobacteria bacterium J06649_4]